MADAPVRPSASHGETAGNGTPASSRVDGGLRRWVTAWRHPSTGRLGSPWPQHYLALATSHARPSAGPNVPTGPPPRPRPQLGATRRDKCRLPQMPVGNCAAVASARR